MDTKRCTKCGVEKELDEFYRDGRTANGRLPECKECFKRREREKYHGDPNTRARKRKWAQTKRDKKKHSEYNKEYAKTKAGKEVQKQGHDKYRASHPERIRAKNMVHRHIRAGHIPHPTTQTCIVCGCQAEHYHHVDYSQPLDVVPVCTKCHRLIHKETDQRLMPLFVQHQP